MNTIAGWIRPWYPAGLVGHISRDCPDLLKYVSEPVEGPGWLDPRADARVGSYTHFSTCPACLAAHDPKLAAEVGVTNDG